MLRLLAPWKPKRKVNINRSTDSIYLDRVAGEDTIAISQPPFSSPIATPIIEHALFEKPEMYLVFKSFSAGYI